MGGTEPRTRALLGVDFALLDYEGTMDVCDAIVESGGRGYVCPVPVHGLIEARRDATLAAALAGSTLTVPDGMGVVWALRRLGEGVRDRVYGPELMLRYCARAERQGRSVWLYGGHDDATYGRLVRELRRRFPRLEIAGGWAPPHRPLTESEEDSLAARIDADGPAIVWCAIGSPRQEKWLARMRPRLEAPVLVSVGAAFDYLSGRVRQAPGWMQRSGLEWAWRISREPVRLLPRYASANPRFVAAFARQYARERHEASR
jgi:N-acetylglucosaminyldiphosphoundecaprenol N-acetyl-beta-D-mannosaminyltransferase